jgi:hypothetical protein
MEEFSEEPRNRLDPESALLYAAAIVQSEAQKIDARNQAVHDAANRVEHSYWQNRRITKEMDQAAGIYHERSKQRRQAILKNTALVGSSTLGALAVTYAGGLYMAKSWLEVWQSIGRP